MSKTFLMIGAAAVAMTAYSAPAFAQDQDDVDAEARLNTITITARKQEESLQDTPIAITALGAQDISDAGLESIIDVAKAAPGLFIESYNDRNARVSTSPRFRGIVVDNDSPLLRTASVFMDGVYVTGGIQSLNLQDVERVEIIKGPQSALFGRNTFAGAINYITKSPTDEFEVAVSGMVADRDEWGIGGSISGPIAGDKLGGRISFSYNDKTGHYTNVINPSQTLGDESNFTINAGLDFEPNDRFRFKYNVGYYRTEDGVAAVSRVGGFAEHNFGGFPLSNGVADRTVPFTMPPSFFAGAFFTESAFQGTIRTPDASEIGASTTDAQFQASVDAAVNDPRGFTFFDFDFNDLDDNGGLIQEGTRLSGDVSFDITDNVTFDFLAGYNTNEYFFYADFDSTPSFGFNTTGAEELEDFSIEGRLSGTAFNDRLGWSLGANYVDIERLTTGGFYDGVTASWFAGAFGPPALTTAETVGIFGTLDYEVTDQITVRLEGRYQEDEIADEGVNAGLPMPISPASFDKFLPRVVIDYKPNDNTLLYANYSVGNLPGGFNSEVAELDATQLAELLVDNPGVGVTFDEEQLENYELGWKQSLFDNTLAFNLAAFYMKRSDQIFSGFGFISETDPNAPNPVRTVAFTGNGATTDIYGVEIDGTWLPTDELTLQGSLSWIDASIQSFPAGAGAGDFSDVFGPDADFVGQQAERFPEWAGSFSATYEDDLPASFQFVDDADWYVRSDVFYTGELFDSNTNLAVLPDATDVNVRAGIRSGSSRVELFVTNLLEEDTPRSANNIADTSLDVRFGSFLFDFSRESIHVGLRDKRQIGLRFEKTF